MPYVRFKGVFRLFRLFRHILNLIRMKFIFIIFTNVIVHFIFNFFYFNESRIYESAKTSKRIWDFFITRMRP